MKLEVNGSLRFKCTHCRSDDPVVEPLAKAEVSKGLLLETDIPGSKHSRMVMVNDEKLKAASQGVGEVAKELSGKVVKMMFVHWDYCGKCGTEYIRSIELKETTLPEYQSGYRSGEKRIILPGFIPPPPGSIRAS